MKSTSRFLLIVVIVALALALRVALLAADVVPLDGDEAVVALMAKHILQNGERPIFFYGQPYSGALDAYLTAGVYALIGPRVFGGRLVQMALFALYVVMVYLLAGRVTGSRWAASASALLVAASTPLLTTYTLVSVGGYGESLVLGTLILWLALRVTDDWAEHPWAWAALGAAGGLAFWVLGISIVYLVPAALLILWRDRMKHWRLCLVAFAVWVVFTSPWWIYDFTHDHASLRFFTQTPGLKLDNPLIGALFSLTALWGMRFPWQADLILVPFAVPLVALYAATFVYVVRPRRAEARTAGWALLLIQVGLYAALFVSGRSGVDVTGRYLLPLIAVGAVFVAMLLGYIRREHLRLATALLGYVAAFNLAGTALAAFNASPGFTTVFMPIARFDNRSDAALISFLTEHNGTRGYSNFWVTYRIAFKSDERIILAARLPYKEDLEYWSSDAGYEPYNRAADESATAVYVTTQHPRLDAVLRERFAALGVTFLEQQIGPYHVFYDLSRRMLPYQVLPSVRVQ
jgi:4-amino-4-deoxy-L-arabinose transferase-like glycosyltransferase